MTHGSLFSGIGGFDLAAEWMGWENKFHCEWNPFGQQTLKYYWPDAESFSDITKTDFTPYANRIDILTGGFPCQPYSAAGKRLGKEDERHLWPEMLRAIREISPRWIVGENVRGLTNWNGGVVFDEVQADLESAGYEVTPFLLPACAVNAPHRRDRIWFVAFKTGNRKIRTATTRITPDPHNAGDTALRSGNNGNGQTESSERRESQSQPGGSCCAGTTSNTINGGFKEWAQNNNAEHPTENRSGLDNRLERSRTNGNATNTSNTRLQGSAIIGGARGGRTERNEQFAGLLPSTWEIFPTQSPVCSRNDGIPSELDGITFSKWRQESIKAGGNAIVPQVALQIFKAIAQYHA